MTQYWPSTCDPRFRSHRDSVVVHLHLCKIRGGWKLWRHKFYNSWKLPLMHPCCICKFLIGYAAQPGKRIRRNDEEREGGKREKREKREKRGEEGSIHLNWLREKKSTCHVMAYPSSLRKKGNFIWTQSALDVPPLGRLGRLGRCWRCRSERVALKLRNYPTLYEKVTNLTLINPRCQWAVSQNASTAQLRKLILSIPFIIKSDEILIFN